FFIYQLIKIAQGTRATELLKGILFIIIIKFISSFFQLHTTAYIVDFIIQWSAIVVIVIFQPELRRGIQHIGRGSLFLIRKKTDDVDQTINEKAETGHYMSGNHYGGFRTIVMVVL